MRLLVHIVCRHCCRKVVALALELEYPDGFMYGCTTSDGGASAPIRHPRPSAAAKGLDWRQLTSTSTFKDVQMPSSLTGWDFSFCTAGWTTTGGKLQVNNFSTFMDTCTFKMPALSPLTTRSTAASLCRWVPGSTNSLQQKALVMLGADDQDNRLLDWMTGKQPRKQWTQTVAKADLPLMAMGSFQPLFKITSSVGPGGGYSGWQIESIAINGCRSSLVLTPARRLA